MFKKHLLIMGLAIGVSAVSASDAAADEAVGVTTVSPSSRHTSPLQRFFTDIGRWSTRTKSHYLTTAQAGGTTPAPASEGDTRHAVDAPQENAAATKTGDAEQPALPEVVESKPVEVTPSPKESAAEAETEAEVDIYAPKKGKKPNRYTARRFAGDGDVLVLPSARPLEEGQVNISLDELALWRAQLGVTDDLTLEANSLWGFSIGVNGKYSLIREKNTAVSVQAGAGALTVQKHFNWTYGSLLYTRDMGRGAVHAGGHLVFAHTPDGESYLVPQVTAGADVRIMKHVTAVGELGFGDDVLQVSGIENNTGFINLGLRINGGPVYATGGLVIPMNESFLDSPALGIPFVRIGGTF